MGNLITYINFRGDLTFKVSPFNELDAMLLSQLAGLEFYDLLEAPATIEEYALIYREIKFKDRKLSSATPKEAVLLRMGESERFKGIVIEDFVTDFDEEETKTFYGITYRLSRTNIYVTYRGTDGSLLSWKENFHTLYNFPTGGQLQAAKYLDAVLKRPFARVTVGGHSKGGNLAVYASMFCDNKYKKKIDTIYSFDGPGYMVDITKLPEYEMIKERIKSFVPVECVIGKLMNPPYDSAVVRSEARGIYQHSMLSWVVSGTSCRTVPNTNSMSRKLSELVNNWIEKIPKDEMGRVVEELFEVFYRNGILNAEDLLNIDFRKLVGMLRSATRLSAENKEFLVIIFKEIRSSKK